MTNHLKIAFRQMQRNKLYAVINILGLALSISCVLMLFLFVKDELSYDQHHGKHIYRATAHIVQQGGNEMHIGANSFPVGPTAAMELPEIISATRMMPTVFFGGNETLTLEDRIFDINSIYAVDSNFFDVLKYNFLRGGADPLPNSGSIVLDKEYAEKLFGNTDPIGKTVKLTLPLGTFDFTISGVTDKKSLNSSFEFNAVISLYSPVFKSFMAQDASWIGNNMVFTFIELSDPSLATEVERKMNQLVDKYGAEHMKIFGFKKTITLQPITDVHTNNSYEFDIKNKTSKTYIQVIGSIAILILVLACVNYVNMSTAQAGQRAREVGIRKVMGVLPASLIGQFLFEILIMVVISAAIAILVSELTIPFFNSITGAQIEISLDNIGEIFGFLILFITLIVVLAGIYPAVYLSSFKPISVLKTRSASTATSGLFRRILVVFQFLISMGLVTSLLIINDQFNYIRSNTYEEKGSVKVVIPFKNEDQVLSYQKLKNEIGQLSGIKGLAGVSSLMGVTGSDILLYREGKTMQDAKYAMELRADPDFPSLMGYKLVAGRLFSQKWEADRDASRILINETLCRNLGFTPEEAISQKLYFDWKDDQKISFEVIGVIQDFHFADFHKKIDGMYLTLTRGTSYLNLMADIDIASYDQSISEIQKIWDSTIEGAAFEPILLQDHLLSQYKKDTDTFHLILFFSILSIVISSLGLYAMSVFITERRRKEIGVRKAMGASTTEIAILITSGTTVLVLIAFAISIPLVMYAANSWLSTFVYHTEIKWWHFAMGGLLGLFLAWTTVSYQTFRASITNPAQVLKED